MAASKSKSITRREFVAGSLAATLSSPVLSQTQARPNLLFILADDMGWADLSCYGRPDYKTPNLDRLAAEGIRFTNAYSAAPVCTPTRVGFLTGRYPARLPVGLEEPIWERTALSEEKLKATGVPLEHPTVASLIKAAGYETALIGKWHLGYLPYYSPLKAGYDTYFGNMSGAVDHFTHRDMTNSLDLFEDEVPVERVGYMTDLITDRAVGYLKRKHTKPFYLSLHYTAPHWPWEGPQDEALSKTMDYGPAGFRAGGSLKIYGKMMKSLDAGVGRVLETLKATGLEKNTLVIFTSDNGGERFSFNWPFRGQKMDLYEGGVRVPAIVRWPGVTRVGISEQPTITMDWTATLIAAAGGKPANGYPSDGENLADVLRGGRPVDRTFYWRTYKQGAMRSGKWKYIRGGKDESLYDLSVDEREQADFKESNKTMLERMRDSFDKWSAQMQKYPSEKNTR
jgi:arylsulfatase A-like enzyme